MKTFSFEPMRQKQASQGLAATLLLIQGWIASRGRLVIAVGIGFHGWLLSSPVGVYAQGTAVQSGFAAETSVSSSVFEAGQTQQLTYTFRVTSGQPSFWRIMLSGAFGDMVVRSIESGGQSLWIIRQSGPPSRPHVASWTATDRLLEFQTYPGDVKANDELKITFLISFPDSVQSATMDGWIGESGKAASVVPCVSTKTTLYKANPQN